MSKAETYDPSEASAGNYLTIAYGHGTQLVYIKEVRSSRVQSKPKKLIILRLVGTSYGHGGHWREAAPIWANDGRIICWSAVDSMTPPIPDNLK
jgi:hypothetical protein